MFLRTLSLLFFLSATSALCAKPHTVSSPDGSVVVSLNDQGGLLSYQVSRDNKEVIMPSALGLRFAEQQGLDAGLRIVGAIHDTQDGQWEQPWGERRFIRNNYSQLSLSLERELSSGKPLIFSLVVRVFNDGVGFRYDVPKQSRLKKVAITEEITEFNMDSEATAWWIPAREWNRYEYLYNVTKVDKMTMAHTPVTMKLSNGIHVSLHWQL